MFSKDRTGGFLHTFPHEIISNTISVNQRFMRFFFSKNLQNQ